MTGRSRMWWKAGAALFLLLNVAGAGYAIAMGEPMHAFGHAVLVALSLAAYLAWRVARPSRPEELTPILPDGRVDYLQQSIDALALEVERIGEAQRFRDKQRLQQRDEPPSNKEQ